MKPHFSLLVPAHNEEQVIGRCLRSALGGLAPSEVEVAVVCNGCLDATVTATQAVLANLGFLGPGSRAHVLEVTQAGKVGALNAGDAVLTSFPRVYLDADIVVDSATLEQTVATLRDGAAIASPAPHLIVEGRSRLVRAFYAVWQQLPYITENLVGNGFYAMSESGRNRFDTFPPVVADDLFVQSLFEPDERLILRDRYYVVHVPRTVRDLVRVRTRVYFGNTELAAAGQLRPPSGTSPSGALLQLARSDPRLWAGIAAYVGINTVAKMRARRRFRQGGPSIWDRDESSRRGG